VFLLFVSVNNGFYEISYNNLLVLVYVDVYFCACEAPRGAGIHPRRLKAALPRMCASFIIL